MENLAKRLAWARTKANLTQQELAKKTGVAQSTIASWESGARETGRKISVVADFLGVSPLWLSEGRGPWAIMPTSELPAVSDVVSEEHLAALAFPNARPVRLIDEDSADLYRIPKVTLRLQAGVTGFQVEPDRRDGGTMGLSRSWVDRKGFDPAKLLSVGVKGESMEPTFYEGDTVVINLADTKPVDNGVFAVNYNGEAVIKRLSRDVGKWWLMSDNSDQRRFYRRVCEGAECIIIGRVVRREGDHF